MQEEIEISQEDLNNELKKREREEYYEDKLLELKMKSFLDDYIINHELSKYKTELDELTKEKETLLNEKEELNQNISEIEEENNNYEDTINGLNAKITNAENDAKHLDSLILAQQELANHLSNDDYLVNHILQNFPESVKKKIYDICSKNVREALNNNKTSKTKEQKNKTKNKKVTNFTVVSGEREEFVSKGEENESNESGNDNNVNEINKGNIPTMPMMGAYNGQYMMYPYFFPPNMANMNIPNMPNMPNMPNLPNNMKGNPFYFFPVPMPNMPNIQQNNNINKNK